MNDRILPKSFRLFKAIFRVFERNISKFEAKSSPLSMSTMRDAPILVFIMTLPVWSPVTSPIIAESAP